MDLAMRTVQEIMGNMKADHDEFIESLARLWPDAGIDKPTVDDLPPGDQYGITASHFECEANPDGSLNLELYGVNTSDMLSHIADAIGIDALRRMVNDIN